MHDILLVGNPNVGKSTLFNSLTHSNAHTGNFHGVTVDSESKVVELDGEKFRFIDLPGIYSLNIFSFEEEVSRDAILKNNSKLLVVADANSIRKNLYLCLQLNELNINYKLLINNYDSFKKANKNNSLDISKLKTISDNIEIINAKKIKLNANLIKIKREVKSCRYLDKYIEKIQKKYNLARETIIKSFNGIFDGLSSAQILFIKSLYEDIVADRYAYIDEILLDALVVDKSYIYGESRLDKILLNPAYMISAFILTFFASIYVIFFLIGPILSNLLTQIAELTIINPIMSIIEKFTDNVWVIGLFSNGIFSSVLTIFTFLPQVCLLYLFLTVLEDSGLLSRIAYVLDDILSKFGLNGKAIYVMLLGFGCNTISTLASRNMNEKNLKIKTAILNPYLACMARLPIFVLVATAFFSEFSYFVVAGMYLLGLVVAIVMCVVLNKTILKSSTNYLLLEFAPLKNVDIIHVLKSIKQNAVDMIKRIFGVVLSMGTIVWCLTHSTISLKYTANIQESVIYRISHFISPILSPIGLNMPSVVCALVVGVMAKELIVSTMSILNSAKTQSSLIASLTLPTSLIRFTIPSAVSFMIFSLLYFPCISTLAVLKKEVGRFWAAFSCVSQFTLAYLMSFVVYNLMTRGIAYTIIATICIVVVFVSITYIIKKTKSKRLGCNGCKKCNN